MFTAPCQIAGKAATQASAGGQRAAACSYRGPILRIAGETWAEVWELIRRAIELHLEDLQAAG
jgi:hypothetical protein